MKLFGLSKRPEISPQLALQAHYADAGLNGFVLAPELALRYAKKDKTAKVSPHVVRDANGHIILGINDAYVLMFTFVADKPWPNPDCTNPHRRQRQVEYRYAYMRAVNQVFIEKTKAEGRTDLEIRHLIQSNELIVSPLLRLIGRDRIYDFNRVSPGITISFSKVKEGPGGLVAMVLRSTDGVDRAEQHKKMAKRAVEMYSLHLACQGLTLADIQNKMYGC